MKNQIDKPAINEVIETRKISVKPASVIDLTELKASLPPVVNTGITQVNNDFGCCECNEGIFCIVVCTVALAGIAMPVIFVSKSVYDLYQAEDIPNKLKSMAWTTLECGIYAVTGYFGGVKLTQLIPNLTTIGEIVGRTFIGSALGGIVPLGLNFIRDCCFSENSRVIPQPEVKLATHSNNLYLFSSVSSQPETSSCSTLNGP